MSLFLKWREGSAQEANMITKEQARGKGFRGPDPLGNVTKIDMNYFLKRLEI
jgi:hypothetical protein